MPWYTNTFADSKGRLTKASEINEQLQAIDEAFDRLPEPAASILGTSITDGDQYYKGFSNGGSYAVPLYLGGDGTEEGHLVRYGQMAGIIAQDAAYDDIFGRFEAFGSEALGLML